METNPDSLPVAWRYKLLTGLVVPRPIAVVSSLSPEGTANVAPFSYFSIAGHNPMALSFTVAGAKPDRTCKDTLRNVRPIEEGGTGEFVVNIAVESYATAMARSSAPLPDDQSEFEFAGLTPLPSRVVRVPRVGESPACFECRTLSIVPIGQHTSLVIGEVVHLSIRDDLVDSQGRIDFDRLKAIGLLAGLEYCRTSDRFELPDEGYFPSARLTSGGVS